MKRLLLILTAVLLFGSIQAQKYACVNTEYILHSVPEYTQALNKLNRYAEEWKQEIQTKQQEVDELRQQYQQEAYLLPDNLKQRRQDEIHTKETELRELQRQRFGTGGDLDQKRAELLKPIQDRIYNAIERVAREKNYGFVFDKAASATVLYVSDKYDISDNVLEMLGVKPGDAAKNGSNAAASPTNGKSPSGSSAPAPKNSNANKEKR